MKKRVAIFANGWSNEYLELVLEGVRKRAAEVNVDLFAFVNFSSGDENKPDNIGERGIIMLPNLKDFDGIILMANTINIEAEREYLSREILKNHIPAVSFEYEIEGIPYLGTDTYKGVYELVTHVIRQHNARKFLFVSGPCENEESKLRMQATMDALNEFHLSLDEDFIFDAGWSYYGAYEKTLKWVKSHEELPDAIICANDEMAIGVSSALTHSGIDVPEQVIVTGCDDICMGQEFYPILTTVAREWDKLGYEGMELLLRRMAGQQVPMKTMFHSSVVIGESCGCQVEESRKKRRLHSIVDAHRKQREYNMNEWHLRFIDEMLVKMTNVNELKKHMRWNFEYNHDFEGADFLISLVDNYFAADEARETTAPGEYPQLMEVYINLSQGKATPDMVFPAKQLMPYYEEDVEGSHIYMFVPLHTEENCIGYLMQKDKLESLYEQTLYTWVRHISQDLDRVRQNIRLEELNKKLTEVSMTDGLTGLKNRTGFDILALPYLQKCQKEGKNSAIVFADINRMKMINDKYGHIQGDLAICTVAEALKRTLPKDWIAVRYGGDEFIMVGECCDMEEAESIKEKLAITLEGVKEERQLVFPLTASFGAVIMYPGENYSLEEYLRKADEAMYATKQRYHAGEGCNLNC